MDTRILAADTLAYLIETSPALQRVAAISNHLIVSMASFLTWRGSQEEVAATLGSLLAGPLLAPAARPSSALSLHTHAFLESCVSAVTKELRRSAFRVFASLGANDEDIRKRVMETDSLMHCLVDALEDTAQPKLQMAAVGCLHSLSR